MHRQCSRWHSEFPSTVVSISSIVIAGMVGTVACAPMLPDAPATLVDHDPDALGVDQAHPVHLDLTTYGKTTRYVDDDGFTCDWAAGSPMYLLKLDLPSGDFALQLFPTERDEHFHAFATFDSDHDYALRRYAFHVDYDVEQRLVDLTFAGEFEAFVEQRMGGPVAYDVWARFPAEGHVKGQLPRCEYEHTPWWWELPLAKARRRWDIATK